MGVDINPKFAVHAVTGDCQLSCQNGGYCTFLSAAASELLPIFSDGGLIEHCVCPPGFTGLTCGNAAQYGGTLGADCSEADEVSSFAGAMCREPSTSYCGTVGITNRGFCTNGGLCTTNLSGDSDASGHGGCQCPPEFEGPHCEYLKGHTAKQDASEEDIHVKSSTDQIVPTLSTTLSNPVFEAKTIMATPATPKDNNAAPPNDTGVFIYVGLVVCISLSVFGLALMAYTLRRAKRSGSRNDILERGRYRDETPIRARVFGELEGVEHGEGGYVDDDMQSVRSECSLEEIELEDHPLANNYREYLQNIRDGAFESYFDKGLERHDFSSIIGPVVDSRERREIS